MSVTFKKDRIRAKPSSVFVVGQNNVTAYLSGLLGAVGASLIPTIEAAYPIGSNGLNSSYDVIAAIFTDFIFQCVSISFNISRFRPLTST